MDLANREKIARAPPNASKILKDCILCRLIFPKRLLVEIDCKNEPARPLCTHDYLSTIEPEAYLAFKASNWLIAAISDFRK
jgi:hypothetical protein